MNNEEILKFASENGIIDVDNIADVVEAMRRAELLKKHPFTIWQNPKGEWCTHVLTEDDKRVVRRRKTKEQIEEIAIKYVHDRIEKVCLKDMFEIWIEMKTSTNEIRPETERKYRSDFKRFFKDELPICHKRIEDITEDDLELFIKRSICDLKLSRKSYSGLRTLLIGMFKRGKKLKHTKIIIGNFFGGLELGRNMFANNRKPVESEIFLEEEIPLVINYLKSHITIKNMALLLQFETGLRVGELVTLKPDDIGNRSLEIRRTEIREVAKNGKHTAISVDEDRTKTEAGTRTVIFPHNTLWTLSQINRLNPNPVEYLFEYQGKRIHGRTINKQLAQVCKAVGIPKRTSHKIRKTYGTALIDSNTDEAFVMEQMGHKDIQTTKQYYYFSNKSDNTKQSQIDKAICY